jgi:hypothetical protein
VVGSSLLRRTRHRMSELRTSFERGRFPLEFVVEACDKKCAIVEVGGAQAYTSGALISQEN